MKENRYYDQITRLNILHYTEEVSYYQKAPLRRVENKLLASIPKNSILLDVGCGPGRFSIEAAKLGYNVVGLDITPTAIFSASIEAEKLQLSNSSFLVGDMTNMPFREKKFDYVFCPRFSINAVATFQKRREAISEMVRVVKPGGTVYIESFNKFYLGQGPFLPLKNVFSNIQKRLSIMLYYLTGRKYTGFLPGDIVYESNKVAGAPKGYAHLPSILELKRLLPRENPYRFYSIPQVVKNKKFDLFKYFRYSIWILLTRKH